jgi:hypothetical protein
MAGIALNVALSIKAGALLMLPGFLAVLVLVNKSPIRSVFTFIL